MLNPYCFRCGRERRPAVIYFLKKTDGGKQPSLSSVASEAEKDYIIRTLKAAKGNKTRAAGILGISRKTLWEKINAYGIE